MARVHFKKHLIHEVTRQRAAIVQSASGEITRDWEHPDELVLYARYVQKTERVAQESIGFMMLQVDTLLVNDDADIIESDRVVDITLRSDSSLVDAGPFTIESVLGRNYTKPHHISLMLERVE